MKRLVDTETTSMVGVLNSVAVLLYYTNNFIYSSNPGVSRPWYIILPKWKFGIIVYHISVMLMIRNHLLSRNQYFVMNLFRNPCVRVLILNLYTMVFTNIDSNTELSLCKISDWIRLTGSPIMNT